jgi:hypothetical protein
MRAFDLRLPDLAGRQHYVVSGDQLREFGSAQQVARRIASGSLERISGSVYRVAGSPATWHQRLLAACFATSGVSAASFRAAAQIWSLPGGEAIVEITSPRHDRSQLADVKTHESFFLTDLDVTYIDSVPVTRPARVICDLGLLVHRGELPGETLELAIHEAFRRDLLDVARVRREWERLGATRRPGGKVIEQVLNTFVPPVRNPHTSPEMRLLQLLRTAGLPEPVPQYRVWLSAARWYDLDFAWPHANVFCEFDSYKWHGSRQSYMRTTNRRLELERHKWYGVPVTDDELDAGADSRDQRPARPPRPRELISPKTTCVCERRLPTLTDASSLSALFAGAAGAAGVAFDREVDQAVEQRGVGDPARFPEARVHRDRREAGDRVQLVHHERSIGA